MVHITKITSILTSYGTHLSLCSLTLLCTLLSTVPHHLASREHTVSELWAVSWLAMAISPKHPFVILTSDSSFKNQFKDQLDNNESWGSIATWLELCWFPLEPLLNIYSIFSFHLIQIIAKQSFIAWHFMGRESLWEPKE